MNDSSRHSVCRLSIMSALEFAVWGAYLTSMSNYMGSAGMGSLIAWFFAIQGLVCLVTPPIVGILADKYLSPGRMLAVCHILAGCFMAGCFFLGHASQHPDPTAFTLMFTLSSACFMPTVSLCNSIVFKILRKQGISPVNVFPKIRVWGTIGFIIAMLFVNFASVDGGYLHFTSSGPARFQFQYWQFLVSAVISFALAAYSLTLPAIEVSGSNASDTLRSKLGLDAISIFRSRRVLTFFIFSMLMGMCVKVTNAYAGPFITSFMSDPSYSGSFGASNATLLTSISQVSEAFCFLLIPFFIKRYGIKVVLVLSMLAWSIRFATLGIGNPGSGLWLLILSMIVYGVAFDFFNMAGAIYLEQDTDKKITASAQGLWMMIMNGVGASVGTVAAGYVIDSFCHWQQAADNARMSFLVGQWQWPWLIFAAFALATAIAFAVCFRSDRSGR